MIIAITGYIGVGKSTVANILEEKGYRRIDVDALGHNLLEDKSIIDALIAKFGMDILDRQLKVDRNKLRELVFNNDSKLSILDSIIHPKLRKEIKEIIEEKKENLVIDIALFNELNLKEIVNKIILVKSDTEKVFNRLVNKFEKDEILNIMNTQNMIVSSDADFIIENNESKEELKQKITELLSKL